MPSTRTARRRRRRPCPSQSGFGALTLVLSTASLVLIAVLSIPAARLSGMAAGPAGAFDSGASGAAASYSGTGTGPQDLRPSASPLRRTSEDPAAAALDEPAVARAAEAGLQRLRVPPAQPLQAPRALQEVAQPVPSTMTAAVPRDVRDPTLAAPPETGRDMTPPALERSVKVLALPDRGPDLSSLLDEGSVTLIGHATLLIRSGGFTILTDPDFLQRGEPARLGLGRTSTRLTDPAMTLEQLPPIDLVVLSRVREDRFDRVVQRRLRRDVPIVVPAASRAELVSLGFSSVHGLQPWRSLRIDRPGSGWLELTATPTRPGPALIASLTPPSMGVLLQSGRGAGMASHRIWISGDTTLEGQLLDELGARLTDLDIALLHLGGARPFGLVKASLDGADAARLVQRLAPRVVLPVPLDDFGDARAAESVGRIVSGPVGGQGSRVRWLARGDMYRIAPSPRWASALDPSPGP